MKTPRIKIDHDRREVFVNGKERYLPPAEYAILRALMGPPAKALTREQLSEAIGHTGERVGMSVLSRVVDQHVHRLRVKIGPSMIQTVQKFGYKLAA